MLLLVSTVYILYTRHPFRGNGESPLYCSKENERNQHKNMMLLDVLLDSHNRKLLSVILFQL